MKQALLTLCLLLAFGTARAQKKATPLKAYVVIYKDANDKATGKYFVVYCDNESQDYTYANKQAKIIAGGSNYKVNSIPVIKGECGIVYKTTKSSGEISMRFKSCKTKDIANTKANALRESQYSDNEVLEILCL